MARLLVTGGSGFIGGHVVTAALRRGHHVVALTRDGASPGPGHPRLVVVSGDVRDPEAVRYAAQGFDAVLHVAGLYTFDPARAAEMLEVNAQGTRNVMECALAAGVARIVYTGTVGTTDFSVRNTGRLPNEDDVAGPGTGMGPYKRSKLEAERIVAEMAAGGAPIVTVCPTAPVGPGDHKPTPTGRIVVDFMRGRMFAYVETGLNFVHVTDVAEGHLLALERGRDGARYLLGSRDGNLTLAQAFGILSGITGVRAPRVRVPCAVAVGFAQATAAVCRALRRPPLVGPEAARMASTPMWVDPSRSVAELGLPQTPVVEAFREAVDWFAHHGYASAPRSAAAAGRTAGRT